MPANPPTSLLSKCTDPPTGPEHPPTSRLLPWINPVSLSYQLDTCVWSAMFPRMCCENKATGFVIITLVCDDTSGSRGSWPLAEPEKHLQRASWRTTEQSCIIHTTWASRTLWRETTDIEEKPGGGEGGKIILKQIVKKWDVRMWSEFIWLRTEHSRVLVNKTFKFHVAGKTRDFTTDYTTIGFSKQTRLHGSISLYPYTMSALCIHT